MAYDKNIMRVGDEPTPLPLPVTSPSKSRVTKPQKNKDGRFSVVNTFADFTLRHLDGAEIAVWLLLWRDTKPDGMARTSQADLAVRAGINERTVRRALAKLNQLGLVQLGCRGGVIRGPSTYLVKPLIVVPKEDMDAR